MRGINKLLQQLILLVIVLLCGETGVDCRKAKSIIIVGAGAAGLAAASRLVQKHGYNASQITILEGLARIGGRIHTTPYGSGLVELGAQFCHGTDNIVYNLAAPAGLLHTEFQSDESTGWADNVQVAYPTTGRVISLNQWEQYRGVADDIYDSALTARTNLASLGAYFNQEFPKYVKKGSLNLVNNATVYDFLNWEDRSQGIETPAPSWFNISLLGFAGYQDSAGDEDITWKKGFSTLIPQLTKGVNIAAMVRYNSNVTSIKWKPSGSTNQVLVTVGNSQVYKADVVLVTVSLGVLKAQAAAIFNPTLPKAKTNAIKYLGWGTVGKIFLIFKAPWWNRTHWGGVNFLTAPINRANSWTSRLMGFYTMRDQPNLLIGWVSGSDTSFETMDKKQLLSICSSMLKGAIGKQFSRNYTDPIDVIRTQWNMNPLFRGTYSYRSVESDNNGAWPDDLLEPEQDSNKFYRLLFAGEATNSDYYSTVHAAIDTGYQQADRIAGYNY